MTEDRPRRLSDAIDIAGDYQHRALYRGSAVQRFWHRSKLLLLDAMLDVRPGTRILDAGCGSGVCSGYLASKGAIVTGLDGNVDAIRFARRAYSGDTIQFIHGQVDDPPFEDASFDQAICFEVIEHLYATQAAALLSALSRVLKPGGLLLITTPNYRSAWPAIEFVLDSLHLVPALAGEQHVSRFDHRTLRKAASSVGLEPVLQRSICTIGPWLAPLSESLAVRLTHLELRRSVPAGTILAHLYRKPVER